MMKPMWRYRRHRGGALMSLYLLTWLQLKANRRAVTALEYGLIGGVIVAVIFLGFKGLANSLSNKFVSIGNSL
jgi:Flp pilus assembly pilin Flp